MIEGSDFGRVNGLLKKGMDALSLRHEVISHNIANADTPYFKRSEVIFESELKRVLEGSGGINFDLERSHEDHIGIERKKSYKDVFGRVRLEHESVYRNDKNNVDIDQEMVEAGVTAMRYSMMANMMARSYRKLNLIIR